MEISRLLLKLNIVFPNIVSLLLSKIQRKKKLKKPFFSDTVSQNSVCVTTKLAQICVERENGCLGLTLRGGGDFPLIVTNIRPHGPVFKVNRIKPGDRLLRVDNVRLKVSIKSLF